MNHNDVDTIANIITIIGCIVIAILMMVLVNSCSASDWNNGICPKCEVRYELRGASYGMKYYACPECGNEVSRY